MRRKLSLAVLLAALMVGATAGCTPVDPGVPMGGRPIEGGTCDPNGVKMFQPEVCR